MIGVCILTVGLLCLRRYVHRDQVEEIKSHITKSAIVILGGTATPLDNGKTIDVGCTRVQGIITIALV